MKLPKYPNTLMQYDRLGAHSDVFEGACGTRFTVWAPNARAVSVVGDFNHWNSKKNPMRPDAAGTWSTFVPRVTDGALYKFEITPRDPGKPFLKADPYAFRSECPPGTASIVYDHKPRNTENPEWQAHRATRNGKNAAISIYEVHLGSWRTDFAPKSAYPSYDDLAEHLVPYVKGLGFTHIELLPITEHPFGGSWGYQPTGMFAPTARYGSPAAFARFVDFCHKNDLGIILDWVPGHFPADSHGLHQFDGGYLFEDLNSQSGRHPDWGTLSYNFQDPGVRAFLISSASFWLEEFRLDGLRVDAVSSMLYLDYSRSNGDWTPNHLGGKENLDAIDFLQELNTHVHTHHPGAITIAEESTAWPGMTEPVNAGGFGFDFKWHMGWMHNSLKYFSMDPIYRSFHHGSLLASIDAGFQDASLLPLSHDEVVHGKGSLITRMPGNQEQKFATLRAYYAYMFAHPGKKLLFMGGEFAQEREWDHDGTLDWPLLDNAQNAGMSTLVRDLNFLYRKLPALHEWDCDTRGLEWVEKDDRDQSVVVFQRQGQAEGDIALVAGNFTPVARENYRMMLPCDGTFEVVFNSDSKFYGGQNQGSGGRVTAEKIPASDDKSILQLSLPPLSVLILSRLST